MLRHEDQRECKGIKLFWQTLKLASVICLGNLACYADPQPGDIFKEFQYDRSVNLCKRGVPGDSAEFQIRVDDLTNAIRAEVTGYFHTGHIGTSDRMIQVNSGRKTPLPTSEIPGDRPDCYFRYTFGRPSAEIPLTDLKEGMNNFTFSVGPQTCHGFNWPCWGFHSFVVRIYYGSSKVHPHGMISKPASGTSILDDKLVIETQVEERGSPIRSVDVLGYYYDYPFEGSGRYLDWHYMIKEKGAWSGFVGRTVAPPHRVSWDLKWVPDQDKPIQLVARITDSNGLSYMTVAVDSLSLVRRRRAVKMYKAVDVPERFMSRVGKAMKCLFEPINDALSQAVEAQLASIVPVGHLDGKYLSMYGINDLKLKQYTSLGNYRTDFFYDSYMPVGLGSLQEGTNDFFIYSNTEGHMTEVCWPGPALLVAYDLRLPKSKQRSPQPTYPPDSGPFYDTESLRYTASQPVSMIPLNEDRVHLLKAQGTRDYIEYTMYIPKADAYYFKVGYFGHAQNGLAQLSIDGVDQGPTWDLANNCEGESYKPGEVDLGIVRFRKPGNHLLRIRSIARDSTNPKANLTISYFYLREAERPIKAPDSPTGLVAVPIDRSVIQIKWNDNAATEDGFMIERRIDNGPWVQIAQTDRNTNMYVNTSLKDTPYTYRVRAYNAVGFSSYSNEIVTRPFTQN